MPTCLPASITVTSSALQLSLL